MKCPFKFRLEPFEGGQECDPECAWRRGEHCAVEPLHVVKATGYKSSDELGRLERMADAAFKGTRHIVVDDTVDVFTVPEGAPLEGSTFELKVKLSDGAPLPRHAKPGDAGMDLTSRETVELLPGETKMVGTGVSVEIPVGYFGMVVPRSGLGSRGVTLSNCVGIIDSGYRGEIKAPLHNNHPSVVSASNLAANARYNGDGKMVVNRGDRVCQLIVVPYVSCDVVEVDELSDSERGETGFGSSGREAL